MPTPLVNDGPGFHSNMPISELTEHDTRAIEVTLLTPAFLFQCMIIHSSMLMHAFMNSSIHSSHTSEHCICNCCITTLRFTSRSGSRLIQHEWRPTEVRRLAHEGLEAASRQTELGEKNGDEPQQPLPDPAQKRTGTSRPFSFDPNLEPSPQNLHRGEASGPPESLQSDTGSEAHRTLS